MLQRYLRKRNSARYDAHAQGLHDSTSTPPHNNREMEDLEFYSPEKEGQNEITSFSEITSKPKDSLSPSSTEQIETTNSETDVPGESRLTNSCSLQVITKLSASTALESPVDPTISNGDASKNLNHSPVENLMEGNGQPTNTTGAAEQSHEGERGYDYELVNKERESEEMCPICCLIPRKPQKVKCCGNVFCHNCINAEKSCPLCRTDNFRSMRDRKCERKIASLKVHCPNHNKGCKWTGKLRNVEEHLKKDPTTSGEDRVRGCGYQLSFCDKCKETVMYVRMKTHLEEDCNHRIITCELESVGCDFSGPKYQMANHIQDDMLQHLSLVTRFVKRNEHHIEKLERNNLSPRHSPEMKSNVYLAISVGIVLVGILAAILMHQQRNQINEHHHLSLLQDDWAALEKIQRIKEADLDSKLTDYGLQLNNLHDIDNDLHKEMEEQKKELSKLSDKVHQEVSSEIVEQWGEISHLKSDFEELVFDAKEFKKTQRIKQADLDMKLTYDGLQLNDLNIKLDLLKHDIDDDLHKEMEEQKKELFKKLKKIQSMKEAALDMRLTDYAIQLNDLKIKLDLLSKDLHKVSERSNTKYIYDIIKQILRTLLPKFMSDFVPRN